MNVMLKEIKAADLEVRIWTSIAWFNLLTVVWFRAESIFATVTAASKNDACSKSGQKRLDNFNFALLVTHTV